MNRDFFKNFVLLVVVFLLVSCANGKSSWPYSDETPAQRNERMSWWRQSRFGMFIHWGIYSVPAGTYKGKQIGGIGEWIMHHAKIPIAEYKAFAKEFNPVKYDPDAWVRLAKEAGMKYIIITAKHHDGFALFDSKVTDWDVVDATPYGKDLLKPLAEACRKHGIKLGFYYSQAQDWTHKGGAVARWSGGSWEDSHKGSMDDYIRKIAAPQVREILTNYGDIAVLWWDTPIDMNQERADMLQPLVNLQPGIITNNRLGGGYDGDCSTPEQYIPPIGLDSDWESCMTMNRTWGFKSFDHDWKSVEMLVRNLVDIASKGGNYLLNVGPTSEGEIPLPSIERLKAVGQWMSVNSESIYGTTASPFLKLEWGRCTKKEFINGATLYLHVFDWPKNGKIFLPGLKSNVQQAYLLGDFTKLKTFGNKEGVTVELPGKPLDAIDTVVVVKVAGKLDVELIVPTQDENGVVELSAKTADIHNRLGTEARFEGKTGQENIGYWKSAGVWVGWPFKINKPGKFEIIADVAVKDTETVFRVSVGKSVFKSTVASTGGLDKYKKVSLGQIEVSKAGISMLRINPVRKQWKPMNLRSITLKLKK